MGAVVRCCHGVPLCVTSRCGVGVRVAAGWVGSGPCTSPTPATTRGTLSCECGVPTKSASAIIAVQRRYLQLQRHLGGNEGSSCLHYSPGGACKRGRRQNCSCHGHGFGSKLRPAADQQQLNSSTFTERTLPHVCNSSISGAFKHHIKALSSPSVLYSFGRHINRFHQLDTHYLTGSHPHRSFHRTTSVPCFGKPDNQTNVSKEAKTATPDAEEEQVDGPNQLDAWLDPDWEKSVFTMTLGERPEPETPEEYTLRMREEQATIGQPVEELNDLTELSELELDIDDKTFKNFDEQLFDLLCDHDRERVSVSKLWVELARMGLWRSDPRLRETVKNITKSATNDGVYSGTEYMLTKEQFGDCIRDNIVMVRRAFTGDLVVPDFLTFTNIIDGIYTNCKANTSGKVADYIPQLARYNPDLWGVSLCTVDGQRHSIGDVNVPFSMQSSSKPISYALAMSNIGADQVHKFVGHEPSGETFNHIKLGKGNKPHNPMINAGAIVTASLLKNKLSLADRFEYFPAMAEPEWDDNVKESKDFLIAINQFRRLAGNDPLGFNNSVYLSERATADRNFALAYYMKENKCFPEGTDLHETLDFYFMLCSIEATCESGAVMASTLANGGICPISGEKVLDSAAVRNTLSLMHSCGMYDYSGEFAFKVGLPGKSGVSGVVLLVVPNVAGFALWCPALDTHGNSARALQFCQELVLAMNFHHYDNLKYTPKKFDPRQKPLENQGSKVVQLLFGAYNGDVTALTRMSLAGENMSAADYDGRTALHLAAAEGHLDCVRFLMEKCQVDVDCQDRWNGTPIDDARRFERLDIVKYLEKHAEKSCFVEESETEADPEP